MSNISDLAYHFAKKNKKKIIEQFIAKNIIGNKNPEFIFMAGAPGAGKTEYSKNLMKTLQEKVETNGIVRIDADEIRKIFKDMGYDGKNSDDYKRGCIKGIEILFDQCIKNKYHTIIDSTFSSFNVVSKNIQAAIKIKATVTLIYLYQDPTVAWGFTKLREKEEGRSISKEFFISSLFQSIANVDRIKKEYGDKITVWLVEKNIKNQDENVTINIDKLDNYIKIKQDSESLNKILI